MNRELVTIMEAAARTLVSHRTIYNWIASGKVEWVRIAGGHRRIYADTLIIERGGPDGTKSQAASSRQ